MKKIKNVSGEDRIVAPLDGRLVLAGQVVEVDDKDAESYTVQDSIWAPVKPAVRRAAKKAASARTKTTAEAPPETQKGDN